MRFAAILLGGVAAGALLASGAALAGDFSWSGSEGGNWVEQQNWNVAGNQAAAAPGAGDTVTVSAGEADLDGVAAAQGLDVEGGVVAVMAGGQLDLGTLTVSGDGRIVTGYEDGDLPRGAVNVSGDASLSGGGFIGGGGVVTVDGQFTQSGGSVDDDAVINAASYSQTGGYIGDYATLNVDTYGFDSGDAQARGNIYATTLFRLDAGGDATLDATLHGTADLVKSGAGTVTLTQQGSDFTGDIHVEEGVLAARTFMGGPRGDIQIDAGAVYRNLGGTDVRYSGSLQGDGTFEMMDSQFAVGGTGNADDQQPTVDLGGLTVSGGMFRVGTKFFSVDDEGTRGDSIDAHFGHVLVTDSETEDGDTRSGNLAIEHGSTLHAETFEMTGGSLTAERNDDEFPDLPNGKVVTDSFVQSAGSVAWDVDIDTTDYEFSGGDSSGNVTFSGLYTLSGGNVNAGIITGTGDHAAIEQSDGLLWADSASGISSYTLSGGIMQTQLTGLKKFTQSGGEIVRGGNGPSPFVETEVYELSGGVGYGFDDVAISKELIISGTGDLQRYGLDLPTYAQTGGKFTGSLTADDFNFSGGQFIKDGNVVINDTLNLSGGELTLGSDYTLPTFTQSGGTYTGNLTVDTYNFSGGEVAGWIDAADAINVSARTGETVAAKAELRGDAGLTKTGAGKVTLSNQANAFTGAVSVEAGALEVIDGALPDAASVDIAGGGTLQFSISDDTTTVFAGTMTGDTGALVKAGLGTLTLINNITLGDLSVKAGRINIGDGTSTEKASFDSAVIAQDATLYIASGATLEIRVPNHLTNNGTLVNDGTVVDDLDNTGDFSNNHDYDADVASNVGHIDNNEPGVWTGDIKSNDGQIHNQVGATWNGAVSGNTAEILNYGTWTNGTVTNGVSTDDPDDVSGETIIRNELDAHWTGDIAENYAWVYNAGGTWTGDVLSNHAQIWNDNDTGEVGTGYWIGDVVDNFGDVLNAGGGEWTGDVLDNHYYVTNGGGTWTGDVLGNNGYVVNDNSFGETDTGYWIGDVVDNYGNVLNAGGGEWTGDVVDNHDYVANAGGTWTGDVLANHDYLVNDNSLDESDTGYWIGDIVSNNGTVLNGGGGDWTGDVLGNADYILNDGSADDAGATWHGTWHGDVYANVDTIWNKGVWEGDLLGNAGYLTNSGQWTGDVIAAGSLTSADTGGVPNPGNTGIITNQTDATWTGDVLGSTGTIINYGTWTGSITSRGTLKGGGTISGAVTNNGTLELIGNMSVGSISFGADSHFNVDVGVGGASERLIATGLAQLDGVVEVSAAVVQDGDYLTPYTILTAGSISGTFDSVTSDLAFLTPSLHYTGTTATVEFGRNDESFENAGVTGNQRAIGGAVEGLGAGNDIYDAVIVLTAEQAQDAFDQLSGEVYASAGAAAASNATIVGDLALDRLDSALGGVEAGGSASGYAAAPALEATAPAGNGIWTQLYGAYGSADANEGTSAVGGSTGGVAAGLDGLLGDWRVGVMLDAGLSRTSVADLDSTVDSTDYGAGIYGGGDFGGTRLKLAGTYTRHDNSSSRTVDFPGFSEDLSADYASSTWQLGGEVSHEFDFGAFSISPFAGAGYVNHQTDGFSETGGAAALTYEANTTERTTATIGASFGYQQVVGDGMLMTTTASLGWRHAFGDAADAGVSLGGAPVTVVGTPVSADLATLGAGINLDVNDSTAVDFSYDDEIGAQNQTHAVTGTWTTRF